MADEEFVKQSNEHIAQLGKEASEHIGELTERALKQVNAKADEIQDELRDSAHYRNLAISSLANSGTTAEVMLAHKTASELNNHLERAGKTVAALIASDPLKNAIDRAINGNMRSSNTAGQLVTWIAKGKKYEIVKGFENSQGSDSPKPGSRNIFKF